MIGIAVVGDPPEEQHWTVILLELGEDRWRPIIGWPSTGSEKRLYQDREVLQDE
jgi:hypothetical protein